MRLHVVIPVFLLCLCACSTPPPLYSPVLDDPAAAGDEFDRTVRDCTEMVDAGVRTDFRETRAASAATGVAIGYGTGAVVFASFAAGESLAGLAAASSVAVWAMPVVGMAAAAGYSRRVRANRERKLQAAMAECLAEHGHHIVGWQRLTQANAE